MYWVQRILSTPWAEARHTQGVTHACVGHVRGLFGTLRGERVPYIQMPLSQFDAF